MRSTQPRPAQTNKKRSFLWLLKVFSWFIFLCNNLNLPSRSRPHWLPLAPMRRGFRLSGSRSRGLLARLSRHKTSQGQRVNSRLLYPLRKPPRSLLRSGAGLLRSLWVGGWVGTITPRRVAQVRSLITPVSYTHLTLPTSDLV